MRPPEHQNEFGFTIGGPIIKKKAFFFFSYDGWRYRVTSPTQLVSVPTLKQRVGDFSEFGVNIYDPLTTVGVPGGCTRTQFSDPSRATATNPLGLNIIPASRFRGSPNSMRAVTGPDQHRRRKQLPGPSAGWLRQQQLQPEDRLQHHATINGCLVSTHTAREVSQEHTEK